jgi:2-aminoadipate transaminase
VSETGTALPRDWATTIAGRWQSASSDAISQILAVTAAPDVISFSGGFPDPATFPVDELPDVIGEVLASPEVALQYAPTAGLPSMRDFLAGSTSSTAAAPPTTRSSSPAGAWRR